MKLVLIAVNLDVLNVTLLIPVPKVQKKERNERHHVIICLYFVFSINVGTLLLIFFFLKCKLYANLLHRLTRTFISLHAN